VLEFLAALDGWAERNGVREKPGFTQAELEDLMKQYPDEPPRG